jgi:uncharacterized damage-inducible protein DinB
VKALLARHFQHAAWADARLVELLNDHAAARRPRVLELFAHVLGAERVWLLRLRGEDSAVQPVWPRWTLAELNAFAAGNALGYQRFIDGLLDEDLARDVAYTNTRGEAFRTPVADVLSHVALHGAYHRGQIAAAVREAGGDPVNTDFIAWVRMGSPLVQTAPSWGS